MDWLGEIDWVKWFGGLGLFGGWVGLTVWVVWADWLDEFGWLGWVGGLGLFGGWVG